MVDAPLCKLLRMFGLCVGWRRSHLRMVHCHDLVRDTCTLYTVHWTSGERGSVQIFVILIKYVYNRINKRMTRFLHWTCIYIANFDKYLPNQSRSRFNKQNTFYVKQCLLESICMRKSLIAADAADRELLNCIVVGSMNSYSIRFAHCLRNRQWIGYELFYFGGKPCFTNRASTATLPSFINRFETC